MPSEESCASAEVASISPLTLPLWWAAVYTGRGVSGKVEREGEERVQTVLARAHGRTDGWTAVRGEEEELKGRRGD